MPRKRNRTAFGAWSVVLALFVAVAVGGARTGAATPTPTPSATAAARPTGTSTPRTTPTVSFLPTQVGVPTIAAPAPTATAASGEADFDRLRDEALRRPLVYGPNQGSLALQQNQIAVEPADVTLRDFAVHVEFTNPAGATEHAWDYGLLFRVGQNHFYRLGVLSTNQWFLGVDNAAPTQDGALQNLNLSANATNALDLIAVGDRGYFGVNGRFVAALDLSANQDAGGVAVAAGFFSDSYIAGGSTPFDDFIIWSFDQGAASPVAAGSATATPRALLPTPNVTEEPFVTPAATERPGTTPGASPSATGNSYTSPTYGYTITWDETWQEANQSSQNGYDFVRLESANAFVDLSGIPWTNTAAACIDALVDFYKGQQGYSDVRIATAANGDEERGMKGTAAWGVIDFTFTASDGSKDDVADYVECRPIEAGKSIVTFEYFSPQSDVDAQAPARDKLLGALVIPGAPGTPAASAEATTTQAAATEAATTEATGTRTTAGPVGLTLAEVGGSGVGGLATLAPQDGQTQVKVQVAGAPAGAVALVDGGSCDNLDPNPAYLLNPLDANGASETTINASLEDLRANGGYAIAVYKSAADLSHPIACGEIPAAG
jgi:hypothetical protein